MDQNRTPCAVTIFQRMYLFGATDPPSSPATREASLQERAGLPV